MQSAACGIVLRHAVCSTLSVPKPVAYNVGSVETLEPLCTVKFMDAQVLEPSYSASPVNPEIAFHGEPWWRLGVRPCPLSRPAPRALSTRTLSSQKHRTMISDVLHLNTTENGKVAAALRELQAPAALSEILQIGGVFTIYSQPEVDRIWLYEESVSMIIWFIQRSYSIYSRMAASSASEACQSSKSIACFAYMIMEELGSVGSCEGSGGRTVTLLGSSTPPFCNPLLIPITGCALSKCQAHIDSYSLTGLSCIEFGLS